MRIGRSEEGRKVAFWIGAERGVQWDRGVIWTGGGGGWGDHGGVVWWWRWWWF